MKRWTLLLISHDTEQPRSIAVSERGVRLAGSVAAFVVLAAVLGIGSVAALVARRSPAAPAAPEARSAAAAPATVAPSAAQVDSLRATVMELNGALDTIRDADARLSAASGVPSADSTTLRAHRAIQGQRATADSLLRHASSVAGQLGQMADSASERRQVRTSRGTVATKAKPQR